jgi:four helix bundle suffix protein
MLLLNQQLKSLEIAFIKNGGMRERMTQARIEERNKNKQE